MLTAFFLPLTVFGGNFFAVLIFLLWIIKADFKNDFHRLKNNKLVIAVFLYLLIHVIALLWTSDMEFGLYTLRKQLKFLFIPIFILFVKREHVKYYISAFLLSMSLSTVWSYGIWLELLPLYGGATLNDPIPLMSRITYTPFLTIAIYLLLYYVLFNPLIGNLKKVTYCLLISAMSINIFITGGRAGQVMFLAMLVITVFQYFSGRLFKAFLASSIVLLSTFSTAYWASEIFKYRINIAVSEFVNYKEFLLETPPHNKKFVGSSVGERMVFSASSWDIFIEHPILGVGTGDFKDEFAKKLSINAPYVEKVENPHNMYALIGAQFGLLGLMTLLYMFYVQIKIALSSNEEFVRKIGIALPLLYLLIMLSDSYLMVHMTGLLFIFISSFIYKDYEADMQYRLKTIK